MSESGSYMTLGTYLLTVSLMNWIDRLLVLYESTTAECGLAEATFHSFKLRHGTYYRKS